MTLVHSLLDLCSDDDADDLNHVDKVISVKTSTPSLLRTTPAGIGESPEHRRGGTPVKTLQTTVAEQAKRSQDGDTTLSETISASQSNNLTSLRITSVDSHSHPQLSLSGSPAKTTEPATRSSAQSKTAKQTHSRRNREQRNHTKPETAEDDVLQEKSPTNQHSVKHEALQGGPKSFKATSHKVVANAKEIKTDAPSDDGLSDGDGSVSVQLSAGSIPSINSQNASLIERRRQSYHQRGLSADAPCEATVPRFELSHIDTACKTAAKKSTATTAPAPIPFPAAAAAAASARVPTSSTNAARPTRASSTSTKGSNKIKSKSAKDDVELQARVHAWSLAGRAHMASPPVLDDPPHYHSIETTSQSSLPRNTNASSSSSNRIVNNHTAASPLAQHVKREHRPVTDHSTFPRSRKGEGFVNVQYRANAFDGGHNGMAHRGPIPCVHEHQSVNSNRGTIPMSIPQGRPRSSNSMRAKRYSHAPQNAPPPSVPHLPPHQCPQCVTSGNCGHFANNPGVLRSSIVEPARQGNGGTTLPRRQVFAQPQPVKVSTFGAASDNVVTHLNGAAHRPECPQHHSAPMIRRNSPMYVRQDTMPQVQLGEMYDGMASSRNSMHIEALSVNNGYQQTSAPYQPLNHGSQGKPARPSITIPRPASSSTYQRQPHSEHPRSESIRQPTPPAEQFLLREEDIELDETTVFESHSSLFGIRRRIVSTIPDVGVGGGTSLGAQAHKSTPQLEELTVDKPGWTRSEYVKVLRKAEERLGAREADLTIEAIARIEAATVEISIYTEQREGRWMIRGPAPPDVKRIEALPDSLNVWKVPIDAKGIVQRGKLKSSVELAKSRRAIPCSECHFAARREGKCPHCGGSRYIETIFIITVTLRVASFTPIRLAATHLSGAILPGVKYMETQDETLRSLFLREAAINNVMKAARKIGQQHAQTHKARLLMAKAKVERRGQMTVSVTSSRTGRRRFFDVGDGGGKIVEIDNPGSLSNRPTTMLGTPTSTSGPFHHSRNGTPTAGNFSQTWSSDSTRTSLASPVCSSPTGPSFRDENRGGGGGARQSYISSGRPSTSQTVTQSPFTTNAYAATSGRRPSTSLSDVTLRQQMPSTYPSPSDNSTGVAHSKSNGLNVGAEVVSPRWIRPSARNSVVSTISSTNTLRPAPAAPPPSHDNGSSLSRSLTRGRRPGPGPGGDVVEADFRSGDFDPSRNNRERDRHLDYDGRINVNSVSIGSLRSHQHYNHHHHHQPTRTSGTNGMTHGIGMSTTVMDGGGGSINGGRLSPVGEMEMGASWTKRSDHLKGLEDIVGVSGEGGSRSRDRLGSASSTSGKGSWGLRTLFSRG